VETRPRRDPGQRRGKRLQMLFQSSINPSRQTPRAIVKQAAAKVGHSDGAEVDRAAVYFSADPGNPDTVRTSRRPADVQLQQRLPDPQRFMDPFVSWEIAQKANKWAGLNSSRLAQRRIRPPRSGGADRDGPGQARARVHPDDNLIAQHVVSCRSLARKRVRRLESAPRHGSSAAGTRDCWNIAHWYRRPSRVS